MSPSEVTLDCGWCGGTAFKSTTGYFTEDEGEACADCGFPGHVGIEQDDHATGDDPEYTAYWVTHDDDDAIVAEWVRTHPEQAVEFKDWIG